MRSNFLFNDGDLFSTLEGYKKRVIQTVDSIPEEDFLITSEDEIVEQITSTTK